MALKESEYGIICVTPENIFEPWLNFEAGALSNALNRRVSPLLVGVSKSDVSGPLAQYNLTETNADDVRRLIDDLNERLASPLPESRLRKAFETYWSEFETGVAAINAMGTSADVRNTRTVDEKLDDIIDMLRSEVRLVDDLSFNLVDAPKPQRTDWNTIDILGMRRPQQLAHLAEREYFVAKHLARGSTISTIAADIGVGNQRIRAIARRVIRSLGLKGIRELREYMNALSQQQARSIPESDMADLRTELAAMFGPIDHSGEADVTLNSDG